MKRFALLMLGLAFLARSPLQAQQESLHTAYATVLKKHVRDGMVDYAALKKNPEDLNRYLDQLAAVSRKEYDGWNKDRQLAYLINLYNAATLKLIIDHYPVKSIKDIGGWFSGPWKQEVVRLWGKTVTLNHLEHEIIRKDFKENPATHFALVCAAKGCPPLRNEPYDATGLDKQLTDQRQTFLANSKKNRVDAEKQTLHLSPIFKWYDEDFEQSNGSVQGYLKQTDWPQIGADWKISYTDYNWELNDVE